MLDNNLDSDYNAVCLNSDYFCMREEHMMEEVLFSEMAEYNQLQKNFERLYHKFARQCGLSDTAFWILYSVKECEEAFTQKELCEEWFYSKQTVNSALKQLQTQGIIKLIPLPGNKKNKQIYLTEEGELLVAKTVVPLMKAEQQALGSLNGKERKKFLSLTKKYMVELQIKINEIIPINLRRD